MADREKVIKGLTAIQDEAYDRWVHRPYIEDKLVTLIRDGIPDALALLREQEPRVMTLEELYDAEYVFYEDDKIGVLCLLSSGNDEDESYFTSRRCDIIQRRKDNYRKSWRCWTSRPTDEQRKAVKWDGDR